MKKNDILCSAILQQDVEAGLDTVLARNTETESVKPFNEIRKPVEKIHQGVMQYSAIAACLQFFNRHGITYKLRDAGNAQQELRFGKKRMRLICHHIEKTHIEIDELWESTAFVKNGFSPAARGPHAADCHYIFAFFTGQFEIAIVQDLSRIISGNFELSRDTLRARAEDCRIFLTGAPSLAECRRIFKRVKHGTQMLQYPEGTPTWGMGCQVKELPAFRDIVHWGGV